MSEDPTSLDNLHDILMPDPVPWWPPAPGWWWVTGFAALAFSILLVRGFIRWQHNRYRREALGVLSGLEAAMQDPARRPAALLELAGVLKRTALTAYPREQVASLTGPAWFSFLDDTGRETRFSKGIGETIEHAVHDPRTVAALDQGRTDELVAQVRQWITSHRVPPAPSPC